MTEVLYYQTNPIYHGHVCVYITSVLLVYKQAYYLLWYKQQEVYRTFVYCYGITSYMLHSHKHECLMRCDMRPVNQSEGMRNEGSADSLLAPSLFMLRAGHVQLYAHHQQAYTLLYLVY